MDKNITFKLDGIYEGFVNTSLINKNNIEFVKLIISLNVNLNSKSTLDDLYNSKKIKDYKLNLKKTGMIINSNNEDVFTVDIIDDNMNINIVNSDNNSILELVINNKIDIPMFENLKNSVLEIIKLL